MFCVLALMHAAIFGNVAAIIQKLYANRVRYHSRANEIKQFIRVHHIDGDLSNRLEDYFHTTWSLSGGVDTREVARSLGTDEAGWFLLFSFRYGTQYNRNQPVV